MSTPRPQKGKRWSVAKLPDNGVTIPCSGQDADCPFRVEDHGPLIGPLTEPHFHESVEGVAAPLEPTAFTAEEFRKSQQLIEIEYSREAESLFWNDKRAEAYAAAVSKNLAMQTRDSYYEAFKLEHTARKAVEARIVELEKEIAALRETK